MAKKKIPGEVKVKKPNKEETIKKPADPEDSLNVPEEDPDIIPEDDPYENPPAYEKSSPGEGP